MNLFLSFYLCLVFINLFDLAQYLMAESKIKMLLTVTKMIMGQNVRETKTRNGGKKIQNK